MDTNTCSLKLALYSLDPSLPDKEFNTLVPIAVGLVASRISSMVMGSNTTVTPASKTATGGCLKLKVSSVQIAPLVAHINNGEFTQPMRVTVGPHSLLITLEGRKDNSYCKQIRVL